MFACNGSTVNLRSEYNKNHALDAWYEVRKGYYYYKQLCPIGQKGMTVAQTYSTNTSTCAIAFASNGTGNPNAFVLVNNADNDVQFDLTVLGGGRDYRCYRTSKDENCVSLDNLSITGVNTTVMAPPNSVTTFIQC